MSEDEAGLPDNVVMDASGDAQEKTNSPRRKKSKPKHQLKLLFECSCPQPSEVHRLHPAIKRVYKPKRKSNIRYCILQFKRADICEEVRLALDGKHIEPYPGKLRCTSAVSDLLKVNRDCIPNLSETERVTQLDIRLLRRIKNPSNKITEDVKMNSTARELYIRYGVCIPFNKNEAFAEQLISADELDEVNDAMKSKEEDDLP